MLHTNI